MIVKILILFFTILIFIHFYEVLVTHNIIEEFETTVSTYTPTAASSDPTVVSKINASNITYLKTQTDLIPPISNKVDELAATVKNNSAAIMALSKQTSNAGFSAVGRSPNSKKPLPAPIGV
jgi:hypothetical protein